MLIFNGIILEDKKIIGAYKIEDQSEI